MTAPRTAYAWEESARKVTVTAVTATAARIAQMIAGQPSTRQGVYHITRAQFKRFQEEFAKVCKHPPARLYAWTVEGVLYTGCSDCGKLLSGQKLPHWDPYEEDRRKEAKKQKEAERQAEIAEALAFYREHGPKKKRKK